MEKKNVPTDFIRPKEPSLMLYNDLLKASTEKDEKISELLNDLDFAINYIIDNNYQHTVYKDRIYDVIRKYDIIISDVRLERQIKGKK